MEQGDGSRVSQCNDEVRLLKGRLKWQSSWMVLRHGGQGLCFDISSIGKFTSV
jgi:hypothetical protein